MRKLVALLTVLGCTIVFAETSVNISGVVKSGSDPVEGATVILVSSPSVYAVTNASGEFTLEGVGVRTSFFRKEASSFARMQGNRLIVAATLQQKIDLTLFNGLGKQVFSASMENTASPVQHISFPRLSTGLYVLKITAGNKKATFKQVFSSTQKLSIERAERLPAAKNALGKKSASADKVVALKNGYLIGTVPVSSFTATDVEIPIEASKQFQPTTTFDHMGSMVKINAKDCNFSMGQPVIIPEVDPDNEYWDLEYPVHTVSFTYDFHMDTTEITQKMYDSVMVAVYGDNYSRPSWSANFGLGDNIPSYHINAHDAILFCNARSKLESIDTVYSYSSITGKAGGLCEIEGLVVNCSKNGYRLPTEAEWEYACRGGSVTDFYWNKNFRPYPANAADSAEMSEYAIWRDNSAKLGNESPQYGMRVGCATKKANPYGLYDMIGSAGEWVHAEPLEYTEESWIDPKPTTEEVGILADRGGNWGNDPVYLRAACRASYQFDYPYFFFGFRTVKEIH